MGSAAPALLGVACALLWGSGDFAGGLAAKRAPAPVVALFGQAGSLALLLLALVVARPGLPARETLAWAVLAGLGAVLGTTALYASLASGAMALGAPIAALVTAVIPVLASLVLEGAPTPLHSTGFVLAALGIWMLLRSRGRAAARGLGYALVAGVGFGLALLSMRNAARTELLWPLVIARACGFSALLVLVLVRKVPQKAPARSRVPVQSRVLGLASGGFDTLGTLLFVLATRLGRLGEVSVLAALYPASTLLLARVVLGERLGRTHQLGLALALAAAVLLAL